MQMSWASNQPAILRSSLASFKLIKPLTYARAGVNISHLFCISWLENEPRWIMRACIINFFRNAWSFSRCVLLLWSKRRKYNNHYLWLWLLDGHFMHDFSNHTPNELLTQGISYSDTFKTRLRIGQRSFKSLLSLTTIVNPINCWFLGFNQVLLVGHPSVERWLNWLEGQAHMPSRWSDLRAIFLRSDQIGSK